MRAATIFAGLALAVIVGNAPGIIAEASAAPACEHRSDTHIAEHGGLAADSAWHVAHGDLPTCDPGQASETEQRHERAEYQSEPQDRGDRGESRYCRERWYC